jgi:hypothetical protein
VVLCGWEETETNRQPSALTPNRCISNFSRTPYGEVSHVRTAGTLRLMLQWIYIIDEVLSPQYTHSEFSLAGRADAGMIGKEKICRTSSNYRMQVLIIVTLSTHHGFQPHSGHTLRRKHGDFVLPVQQSAAAERPKRNGLGWSHPPRDTFDLCRRLR